MRQISTSVTAIVLIAVALVIIRYAALHRARQAALESTCEASLHHVAAAMLLYLDDSGGVFPPGHHWNRALASHLGPSWSDWCAAAPLDEPTYAMNAKLAGISVKSVKNLSHTVVLFESIQGRDLVGGPDLFPKSPRHPSGHAVAFVDGRVTMVSPRDIGKLTWKPSAREEPR